LAAAILLAVHLGGAPDGVGEPPASEDVTRRSAVRKPPALRRAEAPSPAESIAASSPTNEHPPSDQPTVKRFSLESPKGWSHRRGVGCRLIVASAPAWYTYDDSLFQAAGTSLRDYYPSERFPTLEGAACLVTLVGQVATGGAGWNIEAVLVVDGVEVEDLGAGGTGGSNMPSTGRQPATRWNIPVNEELLGLLARATSAEVRFRPRRLTRKEELSEERTVQINGKRFTMREYIAGQKLPDTIVLSEEALLEFQRLR
jgi:hypothetical protein